MNNIRVCTVALLTVLLMPLLQVGCAMKTLQAAAARGDAAAQNKLGNAYYDGKGVPQDYAAAVKYFRLAAEQGLAEAQFNLGFAYVKGNGVPLNYAEAIKWVGMAAEQGNADAQYNLGYAYEKGLGVPQNVLEAYKWFNLAAAQGDQRSVEHRDILTPHMTPEQIALCQKNATEFVPKKAASATK